MKAATDDGLILNDDNDISIHAAREGGDAKKRRSDSMLAISIHAAREGGDCRALVHAQHVPISIHAAREGGDHLGLLLKQQNNHFNPRRP